MFVADACCSRADCASVASAVFIHSFIHSVYLHQTTHIHIDEKRVREKLERKNTQTSKEREVFKITKIFNLTHKII